MFCSLESLLKVLMLVLGGFSLKRDGKTCSSGDFLWFANFGLVLVEYIFFSNKVCLPERA